MGPTLSKYVAEVGANEENGNIVTEEVAEVSAENAATAEEVEEGMDSSTPLVETTESSPPPPPDEVTTSSPPSVEAPTVVEYSKNGATFVCNGATEVENEVIYRSEERVSVSRYLSGEHCAEFSSIMKPGRNLPAPAWFYLQGSRDYG